MNYVFKISQEDFYLLDDQVAAVMRKRLELYSRKKVPFIWNITDKINSRKNRTGIIPKRYTIYGYIFTIIGVLMVLTGLLDLKSLKEIAIYGIFMIIMGFVYRSGNKQTKFSRAEKKMIKGLTKRNMKLVGKELHFTGEGIYFNKEVSNIKLESVENIFITEEAYLMVFPTKLIPLLKRDLKEVTNESFEESIIERFGSKVLYI